MAKTYDETLMGESLGIPTFLGSTWTDSTIAPTRTSPLSGIGRAGLILSVFGGIGGAIGNYYAAKAQQYQAKSEALSYRFQSDMAALNAGAAERDAQSILESGKSEIARYTLDAGQRKAGAKTSMAARGVVLGEGSARDVEASMDLVKDIDVLTINSNAVRQAEAERMRAQQYRTQSTMFDVSAQNARLTARSISPWMSAGSSLIGSASSIANQWDWRRSLNKQIYGGR